MCYETRARRAGASSNLQLRERGARAEPRLRGGGALGIERKKKRDIFFHKGTMNLASIAPEPALLGAAGLAGFGPSHFAGARAGKTGVVLGLLIMNF